MNKFFRDTKVYYLCPFRAKDWFLNVYIIRSNQEESIHEDESFNLIEKHLGILEQQCISSEFEYFRVGFAFLHYGNRGVDLTVWHYGSWGETFEIFSCSWYCYERNLEIMELLDSAEPVICQYEITYLKKELSTLYELIEKCENINDFRIEFLNAFNCNIPT